MLSSLFNATKLEFNLLAKGLSILDTDSEYMVIFGRVGSNAFARTSDANAQISYNSLPKGDIRNEKPFTSTFAVVGFPPTLHGSVRLFS
jgi:hypothetical protein